MPIDDSAIDAVITQSIRGIESDNADAADIVDEPISEIAVVPDTPIVPDTTTTEVVPSPAAKTPEEEAAAAAALATVKPNPEDEFDFDKVPEKGADGRTNRIPQPRVKKMVEASVKKAETKWTAEKLTPVQAKVDTYETRLKGVEQVENIMFNDAARMLGILRTIPGYAELLDGKGAVTPPAAAAVSIVGPRPAPDGFLPDGVTPAYTADGLDKLLQWTADNATEKAVLAAEAKLGKRIKPFEDARTASEERAQQSIAVADELNVAAKWDGFVENADAILAVIKADQKISLLDAYHKVVWPKFKADQAAMRASLMAEIAKAPRSTAAGAAAVSRAAAVVVSDDPAGDVVRKAIRNVGR